MQKANQKSSNDGQVPASIATGAFIPVVVFVVYLMLLINAPGILPGWAVELGQTMKESAGANVLGSLFGIWILAAWAIASVWEIISSIVKHRRQASAS